MQLSPSRLHCFQALILTMLGRDAVLYYGPFGGLVYIFLVTLPTYIMSQIVTPKVGRV